MNNYSLQYEYQFPDGMELNARFDIIAKYEKIHFPVYSDVIIKVFYDNDKLDIAERQTIKLPYSGTFSVEHYKDNTICMGILEQDSYIPYSDNYLIYDYIDMLILFGQNSMKIKLPILNKMIDYLYEMDYKVHN